MSTTPPEPLTFEQALAELDRIVRELEEGKIGLEESLARYETGVALLKQCYGQLRHAELRIQELIGVDEQGNPLTRPFEHTAAMEQRGPQ
ncbi:MAG: exodeoxyribonuclease VII small subunit [Gemmataceae bacterium]|nr:exodeoxyribonuclease VII small subunit [Gemmataceae bacterium]